MSAPAETPQVAPKRSLFKTLVGSVVELDETPAKPPVQQQSTITQNPAAATTAPGLSTSYGIVPPVQQSLNQDMLTKLRAKAYERITPFKTLFATADRMKDAVPDDRARMKAAFAIVCGDGARTPQNILDSIQTHISDVEGERARFKAASEAQRSTRIDAPLKEADGLTKAIDQNAQRLAELQAQMNQIQESSNSYQGRIQDLKAAAQQGEFEIQNVVAQFDAAASFVVGELKQQYADLSAVITR
jgi:hypothetical protein